MNIKYYKINNINNLKSDLMNGGDPDVDINKSDDDNCSSDVCKSNLLCLRNCFIKEGCANDVESCHNWHSKFFKDTTILLIDHFLFVLFPGYTKNDIFNNNDKLSTDTLLLIVSGDNWFSCIFKKCNLCDLLTVTLNNIKKYIAIVNEKGNKKTDDTKKFRVMSVYYNKLNEITDLNDKKNLKLHSNYDNGSIVLYLFKFMCLLIYQCLFKSYYIPDIYMIPIIVEFCSGRCVTSSIIEENKKLEGLHKTFAELKSEFQKKIGDFSMNINDVNFSVFDNIVEHLRILVKEIISHHNSLSGDLNSAVKKYMKSPDADNKVIIKTLDGYLKKNKPIENVDAYFTYVATKFKNELCGKFKKVITELRLLV